MAGRDSSFAHMADRNYTEFQGVYQQIKYPDSYESDYNNNPEYEVAHDGPYQVWSFMRKREFLT